MPRVQALLKDMNARMRQRIDALKAQQSPSWGLVAEICNSLTLFCTSLLSHSTNFAALIKILNPYLDEIQCLKWWNICFPTHEMWKYLFIYYFPHMAFSVSVMTISLPIIIWTSSVRGVYRIETVGGGKSKQICLIWIYFKIGEDV